MTAHNNMKSQYKMSYKKMNDLKQNKKHKFKSFNSKRVTNALCQKHLFFLNGTFSFFSLLFDFFLPQRRFHYSTYTYIHIGPSYISIAPKSFHNFISFQTRTKRYMVLVIITMRDFFLCTKARYPNHSKHFTYRLQSLI